MSAELEQAREQMSAARDALAAFFTRHQGASAYDYNHQKERERLHKALRDADRRLRNAERRG